MKALKMTLASLMFMAAVAVHADPVLKLAGPFEMPAGGMHKEAMTGTTKLYFDADKLAKLEIIADKPIKGLKDIPSAEQYAYTKALTADQEQLGVAFKLVGPPHSWYYVFVANTADQGKTYAGVYYKVKGAIADIETVLAAGVTADPTGWKKIGTGTLAAQ